MARLVETATGREVTLLANHLVGRADRCDLVICDLRVSMGHAIVRWDGVHWSLRDLGSTNRTFVNDRPVPRGEAVHLAEGDVLDFGTAAAWKVLDSAPPYPVATALTTGERRVSEDADILAIAPGAILYRGEGDRWHARDGRRPDTFHDGDELIHEGERYRLSLPSTWRPTAPAGGFVGRLVSEVALRFSVSPGEDRIDLAASCDGESKSLGRHGNNRLLLWLAKARMQDKLDSLPSPLQGWRDVEELSAHTYRDLPRINTETYRIRQRFAPLRLANFADIVERDESQVRLGTALLEIIEATE